MHTKRFGYTWLALAALVLISWLVAAKLEVFELAYESSRRHEDLELGEVFSFLMLFGLSLPLLLTYWNARLRSSLDARQKAEKRAQHVSRHDPLTGLYNRRVMMELMQKRIGKAKAGGKALSVLLMDLDRFRPITDLRGHDVGDAILQEVARRLRDVCQLDQVPIRLGDDEFAVIVTEGEDMDAATGVARRILTAMDEKFLIGDVALSVGISIGIAVWNQDIDEVELLRHADQAMYRAKREGRGRFGLFDDALGERLRQAAEMEAELILAIERAEIVPHFQPIVEIANRNLVGFEVLARWRHERLGQVPPEVFIKLAEDTGQINAISWLVLRQACAIARDWDPDLTIAFNLSPRQFRDPDLSSTISAVLAESDFPPTRLEIEITETAVIEDVDYARATIENLRWLGIRISLDDFGTGFSSLATLSRLPFDKLKIDRSFVTEVTEDTQKAKIVAAIISLAGSLDLSVTAEGIETLDTYEMLAGLNCELGQGFLFDRPLAGNQVHDLLRDGPQGFYGRCMEANIMSAPVARSAAPIG